MAVPSCPLCMGNGTYRLGARVQLRERLLARYGLSASSPASVLQSTFPPSSGPRPAPSALFSQPGTAIHDKRHPLFTRPEGADRSTSRSPERLLSSQLEHQRPGDLPPSPVSAPVEGGQPRHLGWLRRHLLCGLKEQEEQIYQCPFCSERKDEVGCASRDGQAGGNVASLCLASPSPSLADGTQLRSFSSVAVNERRARKVQASLERRLQVGGGVLTVEQLSVEEVTAQFVKKEDSFPATPAVQKGMTSTATTSVSPEYCPGRPASPLSDSSSGYSCPLSVHAALSTSVLSSPRESGPPSPSSSFHETPSCCGSSASDDSRITDLSDPSRTSLDPFHRGLSLLSPANQQVLAQLVRQGYHFDRAYTAVRLSNFCPVFGVCAAKAEELEAAEVDKLLLDLGAVQAREEIDVTRASRKQKVLAELQDGPLPLCDEYPDFMQKFVFPSPTFFSLLANFADSRLALYKLLQLRASSMKAYPLVACAYFRRTDAVLARVLACLDKARVPFRNIWHRRLLMRFFSRTRRKRIDSDRKEEHWESTREQKACDEGRRHTGQHQQEPDSQASEKKDGPSESFCSTFPFLSNSAQTSFSSVLASPFASSRACCCCYRDGSCVQQKGGRRHVRSSVSPLPLRRRSSRHLPPLSGSSDALRQGCSSAAEPACPVPVRHSPEELGLLTGKGRGRFRGATASRASSSLSERSTGRTLRYARAARSSQDKSARQVDGSPAARGSTTASKSPSEEGVRKRSASSPEETQRSGADPAGELCWEEDSAKEQSTQLEKCLSGPDGPALKQQILRQLLEDQNEELQNIYFFSNVGSLGAPPDFRFARALEVLLRDIFLVVPSSVASLFSLLPTLYEDAKREGTTEKQKKKCSTRKTVRSSSSPSCSVVSCLSCLSTAPTVSSLSPAMITTCQERPSDDPIVPLQKIYLRLHPQLWPPVLVARVLAEDVRLPGSSSATEFQSEARGFCPGAPCVSTVGESSWRQEPEQSRSPAPVFGREQKEENAVTSSCLPRDQRVPCRATKDRSEEAQERAEEEQRAEVRSRDEEAPSDDNARRALPATESTARRTAGTADEERTRQQAPDEEGDDECVITGVRMSGVLESKADRWNKELVQTKLEKDEDSADSKGAEQELHATAKAEYAGTDSEEELRRAIELSLSTYSREQTAKRRRNALITDFFPALGKKQQHQGGSLTNWSTDSCPRGIKGAKTSPVRPATPDQGKAYTAQFRRQPSSLLSAGNQPTACASSLEGASRQETTRGTPQTDLRPGRASRGAAKSTEARVGPVPSPAIVVLSRESVRAGCSGGLPSFATSCYHPAGCAAASCSTVSCFSVESTSRSFSLSSADMKEEHLSTSGCPPAPEECDDLTQEEVEEEAMVDAEVEELAGCSSSAQCSSHPAETGLSGEETDAFLHQLQRTVGRWRIILLCMHGYPPQQKEARLAAPPSAQADSKKPPSSQSSFQSSAPSIASSLVACSSMGITTPNTSVDVSAFEVLSGGQKAALLAELGEELWHAIYDEPEADREAQDTPSVSEAAPGNSALGPKKPSVSAVSRLYSSLPPKFSCSGCPPPSSPSCRSVSSHAKSLAREACSGNAVSFHSFHEDPAAALSEQACVTSERASREADARAKNGDENKPRSAATLKTGNWIQASAFFSEVIRQRVMRRWGCDEKEGVSGSPRGHGGKEDADCYNGLDNEVEFVGSSAPLTGL